MINIIKAIIFDVDDTIIDFSKHVLPNYQKTAKELNLKFKSKASMARYFGTPLKNMIKAFWPKANKKKFETIALKKIKKRKFKAIKGSVNTIKELHKNYTLALLSSKSKILMYPHLKNVKLNKNLFKFIYSKEDVNHHKPNPKVFNKPLKKLKLKKEEILYVGDSIHDYIAAKKAGLNFVAVLTGSYKKSDFLKHNLNNNNILKSLKDLPKWLENE